MAQQQELQEGRRRTRVRRQGRTGLDTYQGQDINVVMDEKLAIVCKNMRKITALGEEVAKDQAELFELMQRARKKKLSNKEGSASIDTPMGRSSSSIDPRTFRDTCETDEDFFASIKVLAVEAKKVLPGKVLDDITETTPAVRKDPVLTVKPATKK